MNTRALRMEKRLEWPVLIAALLVIPAIAIEQSSLVEPWDTIARVLNWSTWLVFLGEIMLMLTVVDDRWGWVRDHPLDVAIVILTPPVLPAGLQAARVFRLFRLLRLVKAATLARRLLSTEGLRDAAVLALLVVLAGGAAFAAIEKGPDGRHLTSWDGVWWAMTTVTTVGYGDLYPATAAGRILHGHNLTHGNSRSARFRWVGLGNDGPGVSCGCLARRSAGGVKAVPPDGTNDLGAAEAGRMPLEVASSRGRSSHGHRPLTSGGE